MLGSKENIWTHCHISTNNFKRCCIYYSSILSSGKTPKFTPCKSQVRGKGRGRGAKPRPKFYCYKHEMRQVFNLPQKKHETLPRLRK